MCVGGESEIVSVSSYKCLCFNHRCKQFRKKYIPMCKVYTDVGGTKESRHDCPPVWEITHEHLHTGGQTIVLLLHILENAS